MKGRNRWAPRNVHPVRNGEYECVVRISSRVPPMLWPLEWDGNGFIVPFPMIVIRWRGMTKKAYDAAIQQERQP